MERARIRGRNLRYMLIIGTNSRAVRFARRIETKPELGYRIVGFADNEWAGLKEFEKEGYQLVCSLENLPEFIRKAVIDEIVLALPMRSLYIHASRIVSLCEEQGIITRLLSSIFNPRVSAFPEKQSVQD